MSKKMTRRQWLTRSSAVLGGTALAGYDGWSKALAFPSPSATQSPIRMMFNENPYAPSEVARKAMTKAFDEANLYEFRGEAYSGLKALIAKQEGLTPDHILIASGSTEILKVAGLMAGLEGKEIVSPYPTFGTILNYAETISVKVHRVPLDDSLQFDLQGFRNKMTKDVGIIYLCNPNNPTGTITPYDQFRPFCEEMAKESLVFIDEAYHEFVKDPQYRSMVELVHKGHNVIVSRTSSKIHGLAGLRVGFGIADPKLIKHLNRRMTGTMNIIGLRAALASYQDQDFQDYSLKKNKEAREIVYKILQKMGRRYLPSQTNFIFFHTGKPIKEFQAAMEEQGIRVGRAFPPYLDWCRLSMAKPEEMEKFVVAFQKVMS